MKHLGSVWLLWIAANGVGELLGLGLIGLTIITFGEEISTFPAMISFFGLATLGAVEGAIVGGAQSLVLRRALPVIDRGEWIAATAAGALLAWALGTAPSVASAISATPSTLPAFPPDIVTVFEALFPLTLGAIVGSMLALFQWRILRRHFARARYWIWAHAVAWALIMPLLFAVAGHAPNRGMTAAFVMEALGVTAITGAFVGLLHGAVLVWIVAQPTEEQRRARDTKRSGRGVPRFPSDASGAGRYA